MCVGCQWSNESGNDLIIVDVTINYPKKELILQDFMDVEYIPLETNDKFVCGGLVMACGSKYLVVRNRNSDGNIYIFDRSGKGISKINCKGNSGEEYVYIHNILLDEEREEIFVNDMSKKKILVYDLAGNFQRDIMYRDDVKYSNIVNLDTDNFICWNSSFEGNLYAIEASSFYVVSKSDGTILKEIDISKEKRTRTALLSYDEKTKLTSGIFNTPNTIHCFRNRVLLNEPSSDTIYWYSLKEGLKPYIVRIPSIHTMNPEVFLYSEILTDKYEFMRTYEKTLNGGETDLVYDKQQKAVFRYVLYNDNYTNKKRMGMRGTNVNDEIAFYESLESFDLIKAYEKNILKGELKKIASKLNEEDNPVIMLIKHKK